MFTWKPWMASVLVFIQLVILAQHGQNSSDIVSFPYFSLLFFFFFSHCHPKHKCWGSSSVWSPSSVNSSIVSGPWHVLLLKIYKLFYLSVQHIFRLSSPYISIAANLSPLTVTNTTLPYPKYHRNIHFFWILTPGILPIFLHSFTSSLFL